MEIKTTFSERQRFTEAIVNEQLFSFCWDPEYLRWTLISPSGVVIQLKLDKTWFLEEGTSVNKEDI